jgi:hypothetical protein
MPAAHVAEWALRHVMPVAGQCLLARALSQQEPGPGRVIVRYLENVSDIYVVTDTKTYEDAT